MKRPKLLDLFCCQGGAAMGYHQAGFDVVGVDIEDQPRYPFEFVQGDALEYLAAHGGAFDAIHASPPCQAYSTITPDPGRHPRLIAPTRELLIASGKPYVIENVEGARRELNHPVKVCGSGLGLAVRRHRYFETNVAAMGVPCAHGSAVPVGVYGDHKDGVHLRPSGTSRGVKAQTEAEASAALGGVEWMDWHGMTECIPPSYTEWIGRQLIAHLEERAA